MNISPKYRITKSELLNGIVTFMLLINIFFSFFPAHRGSVLWRVLHTEEAYNGIWIRMLTFLNFGFSCLILLLQRYIKKSNILVFLILLWLFFVLSKVLNTLPGESFGIIIIPIEYLTMYVLLKNYSLNNRLKQIILITGGFWIVMPLILFLIGSVQTKLSFITFDENGRAGTFGGFALHRNYLGYYIGLIIILSLFIRTNKLLKISVICTGIIAIFLSTSRSSFVCLFLALTVFGWQNFHKMRAPFILGLIMLGGIYYHISSESQLRRGSITNTSDREELMVAFSDSIEKSPIIGSGNITMAVSSTYPNGAQAHNFILQIWADYGIFTLLFFSLFWGAIFIYGNKVIKTFITYLISFGLFQPYFMLNIPPPFIWMNIIFIMAAGDTPRFKLISPRRAKDESSL